MVRPALMVACRARADVHLHADEMSELKVDRNVDICIRRDRNAIRLDSKCI